MIQMIAMKGNKTVKVMLVGETWIAATTHYKGWDSFSTVTYENAGEQFCADLRAQPGTEVVQLPAHLVPTTFPEGPELDGLDVLVLSDIGSNSVLLAPQTWLNARPSPNRIAAVSEWTQRGGGLVMVGGYMSFQGLNQAARWRETPLAEVLPVEMLSQDDRVEAPQGVQPVVRLPGHPVLRGVGSLPSFLGYNRVIPKPGAEVVATVGEDPLLVLWEVGSGRAAAWTTDIGPHWCPDEASSSAAFKVLWRNLVAWLGQAPSDGKARRTGASRATR
jgi:uncharacterized membrane protein